MNVSDFFVFIYLCAFKLFAYSLLGKIKLFLLSLHEKIVFFLTHDRTKIACFSFLLEFVADFEAVENSQIISRLGNYFGYFSNTIVSVSSDVAPIQY